MDPWRDALIALGEALQEIKYRHSKYEITTGSFLDLVTNGDYDQARAGDLPAGNEAKIQEIRGIKTLVFDPENIREEALIEAGGQFSSAFIESNGFSMDASNGIATAIKTEGSGGILDEIFEYYCDKIPGRFLPVLKEGLTLRIAEEENNYSRFEVQSRKYEIASAHKERGHDPNEAYSLVSLCSAGYLDQGRLFREIYDGYVERGSWTEIQYQELFEIYVSEKPFVVFVQADGDDYKDIYHKCLGKSRDVDKYEPAPEFIDIRGKGDDAETTIEKTLEYIDEHHANIIYDIAKENNQNVVRIDPNSF
ncbi:MULTISPECIES: hypothetical protein [unclassified Haloferax]|uniref:hypothetical protein n=1 Tax=unclassified Haloferax TaxID=2625095 RepID=UPI002874DDDB|nr:MULTISPECIES: hypothetical protein [unclassified Haloferax]MDS0243412.1 hypothetical protein [Haloferax sp. S2CR25]MDS0446533.1 hypothetical protein [Haloferax sp. S2CR25-2]